LLGTTAQYNGALLKWQSRCALHGTLESRLLALADQGNPADLGLLLVCLLQLPCMIYPLLSEKLTKQMIKTAVTSKVCTCYMQR